MAKHQTETRLSYRIRCMSTEERDKLMELVGIGRTTLFRRLKEPGKLKLDELSAITRFLEELDGEDYDIHQLIRPVEIMPQTAASE